MNRKNKPTREVVIAFYITFHNGTVMPAGAGVNEKNKKLKKYNERIINMPKQKLCIPCAGSPLLCSYAGLVLQRKYGCIILFVARQGERAYANEIF